MDLRTPIGYLFIVLGLILGGFGLFTGDANITQDGENVNLWWGVAMFVFGAAMLAGARYGAACEKKKADASCGTDCGCGK